MTSTDLLREFTSCAIRDSGGLLLLAPADALALVRRAEQEGLPILGVDGIFLTPRGAVSPIEHIADFSGAVVEGGGSWRCAVEFIEERRDHGLVFEVTLGELHRPSV